MWLYDLAAVALAVALTTLIWRRRWLRSEAALARAKAESEHLRRQEEKARQDARARELAVLNSMEQGVLLLDAEGRVQMSNQALDNMGLASTQMVATPFDGNTRHSPEGVWFKQRAEEVGFTQAVRERDSGEPIAPGVARSVPPVDGTAAADRR